MIYSPPKPVFAKLTGPGVLFLYAGVVLASVRYF